MSQCLGAKGRRKEDIEEDEWYSRYLAELRVEEAALPSCMDVPDSSGVY